MAFLAVVADFDRFCQHKEIFAFACGLKPNAFFFCDLVERDAAMFAAVFGFNYDLFAFFVGFIATCDKDVWAKFLVGVRHG